MKRTLFILAALIISANTFAQYSYFHEVVSKMEGTNDWSDSAKISWQEPTRAYVNITGVDEMPQNKYKAKYINMHAWIEVYDDNGNYFKKRVILNGQGETSMSFDKKNFAADFCEDEWIGSKTTSITFGDWVSQDAFHFKAFYTDYFKGIGIVGYDLYDCITADRASIAERAGIKESANAKYHPDAFPCVVFLNDNFYGIFAWQLKKHRKNMNMEKSLAENIHIDGDLRDDFIFRGNIDWTRFEIRNPKGLCCIDTENTDGSKAYSKVSDEEKALVEEAGNYVEVANKPSDLTTEQIDKMFDGDAPMYLKYKKNGNIFKLSVTEAGISYVEYNGDKPKELIDSDMPYFDPNNENHVLTDKVKRYLTAMSKYWDELHALEEDNADTDVIRDAIAERYDIESLIDYYLHLKITMNGDGIYKNWQWFTYDGVKWFVTPYDLDQTHGMTIEGGTIRPANFTTSSFTSGPLYWIEKYYQNDLKERYKKIREDGSLSVGSWSSLVYDWYRRTGELNYKLEADRWPNSPCYRETILADNWTTDESLWAYYNKCSAYSDDITYHEGDMCRIKSRVWKATGTTTGVLPYVFNGFVDSPERVESWIEARLAHLDKRLISPENAVPETYALNISNAGIATICLPFDFNIENGLHLYTIESINDDGVLVLNENVYAEAYHPYLVFGKSGQYILKGTAPEADPESAEDLVNGLLLGTLENMYVPKESYVLQNHNNKVGFYRVEKDNRIMVVKNHAYMSLSPIHYEAKSQYFDLGEISTDLSPIICNDNIAREIYSLDGSKKKELTKGINIVRDGNGNTVKILVR